MPGDPHYQPEALKPYLGYDARAGWLVIVEWFWLTSLAMLGIMPREHANLLTRDLLGKLLRIRMTTVTRVERKITKHDILALLREMRKILPPELHRWLHLGCTSYDIICTAYALQIVWTFNTVMMPLAYKVSGMWQAHMRAHANTLQSGRTHLQRALPVTVGFWLTTLHNRFKRSTKKACELVAEIPGKFSGATGTSAALRALFTEIPFEEHTLQLLGLPSMVSTQITQPEGTARFYHELTLLSGVMGNLGEDIRHLQMTEVGEVSTDSSTSSSMSHKDSNPIAAENVAGMHETVKGEYSKVLANLKSDLQRDLRNSSVMRMYTAIIVFTYQQITTTERIFRNFTVSEKRCQTNFDASGKLVVAELLHLSLQMQGVPHAHTFVNKKIVPRARISGADLCSEMDRYVRRSRSTKLRDAWQAVPERIKNQLKQPETYLGDAVKIAIRESEFS